jgi:uncharacterized membrane protein
MDIMALTSLLTPIDFAAVGLLLVCWFGLNPIIENPRARRPSVVVLMAAYRREWMRQAVTRDPRVYDAMMVTSLRQGTSFFASTCMIAIGGGIALIGNVEQLTGLAQDLDIGGTSRLVWELKLMLPVILLSNAFLKFVWSNRILGYCSIVMGAVPNDADDPLAMQRAAKAGELNILAARSFNRGLRSVYFALGALAWLLGGWALLAATVLTVTVILRREYASQTRKVISTGVPTG